MTKKELSEKIFQCCKRSVQHSRTHAQIMSVVDEYLSKSKSKKRAKKTVEVSE